MQVKNKAGVVCNFNPHQVFMITGTRKNDKDAHFYLHGVARKKAIGVAGDIETFMTTMPNKTEFAEFHFAKNNKVFWIHGAKVAAIHEVSAETLVKFPFAKATLIFNGRAHQITETVADATVALNAVGGSL